jgi:hypothetical protein
MQGQMQINASARPTGPSSPAGPDPALNVIVTGALVVILLAVIFLALGLILVSFKSVGHALVSIGTLGLVVLISASSLMLQTGEYPTGNLSNRAALYIVLFFLFASCAGIGWIINRRWSRVSQPIAVKAPVAQTVTPEKTVINLPCHSIVAHIVPADNALQKFAVSSYCADASGVFKPLPDLVPSRAAGFAVQQVNVSFVPAANDVRVELRNLPRDAFYQAQYGESVSRSPFGDTESVVWQVRDSNDIAFSYVNRKWLPFRHALELFLGVSSLSGVTQVLLGMLSLGGLWAAVKWLWGRRHKEIQPRKPPLPETC